MKKFYIFTVLFFIMGWVFSVNAQDLIILKDGNTIEAKVIEISPTEIRYKRFDHLDGPTIVIMAVDVLSIRYENGRTEIINTVTQPEIITPSVPTLPAVVEVENQPNRNSRLNTIGATFGYQGVSAFGFTLNGTVSPAKYTFFDFNLGLGFNDFAFNGRINFNAFVPFKSGGWYAGIGVGGGYNELFGGVIAGNITTGFIFFNWLNIMYTLQLGNFDGIVNNNIAVGYSYRFKPQKNTTVSVSSDTSNHIPDPIPTRIDTITPSDIIVEVNYTVVNITGQVQRSLDGIMVDVRIGDILNHNTFVRTANNSSLSITDGNITVTIQAGSYHRVDFLFNHFKNR